MTTHIKNIYLIISHIIRHNYPIDRSPQSECVTFCIYNLYLGVYT